MKMIARVSPPAIFTKGGVALTLPAALQGAARVSGSPLKKASLELRLILSANSAPHTSLGQRPRDPRKKTRGLKARSIPRHPSAMEVALKSPFPVSPFRVLIADFHRILLSHFTPPDYMPATCNLHRRG